MPVRLLSSFLVVVVLAAGLSALAPLPSASAADAPATSYTALLPARLMDSRAGATTVDGQQAGGGAVGAAATRALPVLGRGGVPASGVAAVVLNVTVTEPTTAGHVTVFPSGSTRPTASNLNFAPGQTIANTVVAKVGADGKVSIFNSAGSTHVIVDVQGWFATGASYTALLPARLMDSRAGATTVDGQQAGGGAVGAAATRALPVLGRGGVPASGVAAVVLNVTVTEPTTAGHVTVFPSGSTRPTASNLNFAPGQTIANTVVAKVGADGKVSIFNSAGSTHVIVDVQGWFATGASYTALLPARLMDSRAGATTVDGQQAGGGAVGAAATRALPVLGRGGVPASGVAAVVLNVTVTEPTTAGHVTVFPSGSTRPTASNLNFAPGQTIANTVVAKVGADGKVSIFNSAGSTHVIVDVQGWFPAPSSAHLTGATHIAAGYKYACVIVDGGRIGCWGNNAVAELGDGTVVDRSTPVEVVGITNATAIAASLFHTCALLSSGHVNCWGDNSPGGQLGDGTTTFRRTPVEVVGITNAIAIAVGDQRSCALLATGRVNCWGTNAAGQLGDGTTVSSHTPVEVVGITNATAIAANASHTCALLATGRIDCWGWNNRGQLGDGTKTERHTPVEVVGVSNAIGIAAGAAHSCALLATGRIDCWGYNLYGRLGNGTTTASLTPVEVVGVANAVAIAAGGDHSCAVLSTGQIDCWGWNASGQLGDGTDTDRHTPVEVTGITNATAIAAGTHHTCALLASDRVNCWGNNTAGALGIGVMGGERLTPVEVVGIG